ncbi:hypothetical protein QBC35DRAFT_450779 [Podospora australis]|uniref:Mid2 domain-containing protein n=1 Tax=Podospora australis TaxID=1536484 RepID=A0AAN6WYK1_9PEZI|nr:hypothetical protein QBC35DRAFT_450779 [Podospora australis]
MAEYPTAIIPFTTTPTRANSVKGPGITTGAPSYQTFPELIIQSSGTVSPSTTIIIVTTRVSPQPDIISTAHFVATKTSTKSTTSSSVTTSSTSSETTSTTSITTTDETAASSSTEAESQTADGRDGANHTGAIVGGVLGAVILILLMIGAYMLVLLRRRRQRARLKEEEQYSAELKYSPLPPTNPFAQAQWHPMELESGWSQDQAHTITTRPELPAPHGMSEMDNTRRSQRMASYRKTYDAAELPNHHGVWELSTASFRRSKHK